MKADRRWWNDEAYERETASFDAEHPLSRDTWESLQRNRREIARRTACEPWWGPSPLDFIRARTEAGLEIRIRLRLEFPAQCGVAYLP